MKEEILTGKFTINAVDPAGTPWEVCMTDHKDSALDVLDALRGEGLVTPKRHHWVTLTEDPERGDVEDMLED
jgi:hypothetical protein